MLTHLEPALFKEMFLGGAVALNENKELINELNVFPVPDGDTGTNMTMTIMSAANMVHEIDNPDYVNLANAISTGSLKGARGNSGVILSQILRGIANVIQKNTVIDTTVMATALQKGRDTAYKAVMQPKEGTILTVMNAVSEMSLELSSDMEDMKEFFTQITEQAQTILDQTPDMLPVLKEAGVVDSGGMGLLTFLKGMLAVLQGDEIKFDWSQYDVKPKSAPKVLENMAEDIEFGYCTEMIILLKEKVAAVRLGDFKEFLQSIGNSLVFVPDTDMIKLHVHTNDPGKVLSKAVTFGELSNIKIDNMREEHRELIFSRDSYSQAKELKDAENEEKEIGFVVVSAGNGFAELFKELGADEVIEGGQTMNPSTEDIMSKIDKVNAKNVFLFPNNKNIVLACNQARDLTKDKTVIVIPSVTIPQGIAGMMSYLGDDTDLNSVKETMYSSISQIKSFSITHSIRDTQLDGYDIKKDDIMVISDRGIDIVSKDIVSAIKELLAKNVDENTEYISFFRGRDADDETESAVEKSVQQEYPDIDVAFHYGGQSVYYYIISME